MTAPPSNLAASLPPVPRIKFSAMGQRPPTQAPPPAKTPSNLAASLTTWLFDNDVERNHERGSKRGRILDDDSMRSLAASSNTILEKHVTWRDPLVQPPSTQKSTTAAKIPPILRAGGKPFWIGSQPHTFIIDTVAPSSASLCTECWSGYRISCPLCEASLCLRRAKQNAGFCKRCSSMKFRNTPATSDYSLVTHPIKLHPALLPSDQINNKRYPSLRAGGGNDNNAAQMLHGLAQILIASGAQTCDQS